MKKVFAALLAVMLLAQTLFISVSAEENNADVTVDKAISETAQYIMNNSKSDWEILALLRSNRTIEDTAFAEEYYTGIQNKLKETGSPILSGSETQLTDNSKAILTLSAMGINCTDISGCNIVEPLSNIENIKVQGINSAVYALMALDAGGYTTSDSETRTKLIEYILSDQMENGAWAFSKIWSPNGDVDITAMAVQSLAPYVSSNDSVKTAVEKAVNYLSQQQLENGGYTSYGNENCETVAQVIIALTALGKDPASEEAFVKVNGGLVDNMLSFYKDGGGFSHTKGGAVNGMATVQAMLALDSLKLYENGRTLYDMVPEMFTVTAVTTTGYLLKDTTLEYGSEWIVFALARLDQQIAQSGVFDSYVESVKAEIAKTGPVLDTDSGYLTDNARTIIALTSLGIDCTNIDGVNIVEPLSNMDIIKKQGVNSAIYSLLALNTANYTTSDEDLNNKLVNYILDERLENGTWAYSVIWSPNGDIDLTAMAVQALAPYYNRNPEVKAAVDTAMKFLKEQQSEFGYYVSFGNTSSSSTAQVICALQEMGRDSFTDSEFTVNNVSLVEALLAFSSNEGGFSNILGKDPDKFSTTQAMYAITSVARTLEGKTSLYDMTDVLDKSQSTAFGDVDGNGITDIQDVTMVQKYLANLEELSEDALKTSDVDGNSVVDIKDVTAIQKYIAGNKAA